MASERGYRGIIVTWSGPWSGPDAYLQVVMHYSTI